MSKLTLSFKGKLLKYFPLSEGETIIGSDPACKVFIDTLAIQARHASVTLNGDNAVLRDLDTPDGTFVNNARISGEYTLKSGDDIRVGKHTLTFTLEPAIVAQEVVEPEVEPVALDEAIPEQAQEPELTEADTLQLEPVHAPRHAFLQILNGQNMGKTISLKHNLVNLGKPGVQLAVIAHRNDGFFLSHLEGDTPPKVGDTQIGDKAWQLHDGDVIQLGNVRMQFTLH